MANFLLSSEPNQYWTRVEEDFESTNLPCQRSLHSGTIWKDNFIIFAGYSGLNRLNDLNIFNFSNNKWNTLSNVGAPSPRDRHTSVVYKDEFYVFGGFDGQTRKNDLHVYNLLDNTWNQINHHAGSPPSSRHSHCAVVYDAFIYIGFGYDGSYKNDLHRYSLELCSWNLIMSTGPIPIPRYRSSCVVCNNLMILHGGHDGNLHLSDTNIFDLSSFTWSKLNTTGPSPNPCDSHVAICCEKSMYIYGGSTGSAVADFHELKIDTKKWSIVKIASNKDYNESPGARFCHVGVVYKSSLYVWGGYNGIQRLNDFFKFRLNDFCSSDIPQSTITNDLKLLVNNELLSDITFVIEDRYIKAHKILCLRCPYFLTLLTSQFLESTANEIIIEDVKYDIFIKLIEYIYSDHVDINFDNAVELLNIADRFGVERLKKMCEKEMLEYINIDNVSSILYSSDLNNAVGLRSRCIEYILNNFDSVSKTTTFEEMGRDNISLIFEILNKR